MSSLRSFASLLPLGVATLIGCGPGSTTPDTGAADVVATDVAHDVASNDVNPTLDAATDASADAAGDAASDVGGDAPAFDATADVPGDAVGDAGGPHPIAIALVSDIAIHRTGAGTTVNGSYAGLRGPGWASDIPAGMCRTFDDSHSIPLPNTGAIVFSNLTTTVRCGAPQDNLFGFAEYRCAPDTDTPPGVAGSALSGTPLISSLGGRAQVTGGSAIYAVLANNPTPPSGTVTLTAPTTLPAMFTADLNVTWTPIGSTDVLVELEVFAADPAHYGTIVCHPSTDGMVTIPMSTTLTGAPARLVVLHYTETHAMDTAGRQFWLLLAKGAGLAN